MVLKRYFVLACCLVFGLTQTLKAQKSSRTVYEIRVDAYKKIRDTALVRVQQYKNDSLIQEFYCFKIPSCRIDYGLKLGKLKAFKRYESVDVLIPHGKYIQFHPQGKWERVFDRGTLISETFIKQSGITQDKPEAGAALEDILLIDHHRKCKVQEKRYFNIVLYKE